ncbi:MAG: DUF2878 domain-containing protein [Phycisphaerales bacterium]|nr:DUF2878 domain-containing protein [Phycisphaerales bacterium]
MLVLLNIVGFQLVWWSAVLGAARGSPWLGPLVAIAVLAVHLRLVPEPRRELAFVLVAAVIGFMVDSVLVVAGVLVFDPHALAPLAPAWILALWVGFATTVNRTFARLRGRLLASAALGAVGGPLAYAGGQVLGALSLGRDLVGVGMLAATWAALLALLFALAARYAHLPGTACALPRRPLSDQAASPSGGGHLP